MIARPCLRCGDLIPTGSHCTDCKPKPAPQDHVAYKNNAPWKRLSQKLRRLQPWCNQCGATNNLQADHILPESKYPELAYCEENLQVLCRTCNGQRGNRFTEADQAAVIARLEAQYKRRPTRRTRLHIEIAKTSGRTQGGRPERDVRPMADQPRSALHTARRPRC